VLNIKNVDNIEMLSRHFKDATKMLDGCNTYSRRMLKEGPYDANE